MDVQKVSPIMRLVFLSKVWTLTFIDVSRFPESQVMQNQWQQHDGFNAMGRVGHSFSKDLAERRT